MSVVLDGLCEHDSEQLKFFTLQAVQMKSVGRVLETTGKALLVALCGLGDCSLDRYQDALLSFMKLISL